MSREHDRRMARSAALAAGLAMREGVDEPLALEVLGAALAWMDERSGPLDHHLERDARATARHIRSVGPDHRDTRPGHGRHADPLPPLFYTGHGPWVRGKHARRRTDLPLEA